MCRVFLCVKSLSLFCVHLCFVGCQPLCVCSLCPPSWLCGRGRQTSVRPFLPLHRVVCFGFVFSRSVASCFSWLELLLLILLCFNFCVATNFFLGGGGGVALLGFGWYSFGIFQLLIIKAPFQFLILPASHAFLRACTLFTKTWH